MGLRIVFVPMRWLQPVSMLKISIIKKINKFYVSWHDFVNMANNWLAAVLKVNQRQIWNLLLTRNLVTAIFFAILLDCNSTSESHIHFESYEIQHFFSSFLVFWFKQRVPTCIATITHVYLCINTLRPRQMDAISQTTFSNAFSWMKMFEFRLKFHWSLFPRVQLTIFLHWLR